MDMLLADLNKNDKAIIIKIIDAPIETKRRFNSFGISNGTDVYVDEVTLSKNTISIIVEDTAIAMRIDEAKFIVVEKMENI
jgi:Fe2+ transport system protein FeoA